MRRAIARDEIGINAAVNEAEPDRDAESEEQSEGAHTRPRQWVNLTVGPGGRDARRLGSAREILVGERRVERGDGDEGEGRSMRAGGRKGRGELRAHRSQEASSTIHRTNSPNEKSYKGRHFWHERGLGHPGLGVDFQHDESARAVRPVVVAKVRATDAATAERPMSLERQLLNLLVNIRFKISGKNVF